MVYHNSHYDVLRYSHSRFLMNHAAASFFPPIALDHRSKTPMYRQLYDWFRRAILEGQMRPGQRVPSTRGLAAELNISRIPVFNAYEQLLAEGYFETFVGAGTCVARSIPDDASKPAIGKISGASRHVSNTKALRKVSHRVALMRVPAQTWSNNLVAFRVSLPALEHFPIRVWSQLLNRHSRMIRSEHI